MSATSNHQIRILHVDDEPEFTDLTETFLEREHDRFTVETATSAKEGLETVNDRPPDCIVSDYNMPDMDGLEFLETVREEYPDLPFILFTGRGSEEIASDAISAEVTDYLQKDAGSDQYTVLANRVANSVEQYRAKKRLHERERELKRQNRRLNALFENFPEPTAGYVYEDGDPHVEFVNDAFTSVFGYDADEAVGQHIDDLIVPPDRREEARRIDNRVKTGETLDEVVRRQAVDGLRDFLFRNISLPEDDDIDGYAIYTDITDAKEREQRFQTLVEESTDIISILDADGRFLYQSPSLERILGYSSEETLGDLAWEYIHPEDRERVRETFAEWVTTTESPEPVEYRARHADGSWHWMEARGNNQLDNPTVEGYVVNSRDITDRKEHEQQLQEEREFIDQALDGLSDVFYVVRPDGTIRRWNDRVTEVTGYTDEAIAEMQATDFFPEDEHERIINAVEETLTTGEAVVEAEILTADGDRIPYEFSGSRLTDSDGELTGLIGIGRDVTEHKQRERELQRKERIIQEMDDGVVVVQEQTITYTNPQITEIIGYPAADLLGEPMGKYIAPEDRETVQRRYKERLAGNDPPKTYEISLQTREGETVPVEITAARVTYGDEPATVSIVRDITDRKERVSELQRQNERLEEFASIVSHDLRNPLNVASARLELARETCDSPHLSDIDNAHERMKRLIDDLLTLARQKEEIHEMESVSVAGLTESCWGTVETSGATLEITTSLMIRADRTRLKQAIENLIRNAIEHGGATPTVRIGDLPDGFFVADDGPGISEDIRDEIFTSGYSSAADGTGFGLAIVREIVEAHDWEISVSESEDAGARFEITGVEIVDS